MERTQIRVLYGDVDQMGFAYYANYLRWFEAGRNEFIRAKGLRYRDLESEYQFILPVTEATVRYRVSARYDDLLTIEISLAELRRASLRFAYGIRRDDELLATGETTHACLGTDGRLQRLPAQVIERLMAREQPSR
jgi:acyl-CoA thioester hydrolase